MQIDEVQSVVFQTARDKGWWDDCSFRTSPDGIHGDDSDYDRKGPLNLKQVEALIPEKLALIHSEVTEAYEDFEAGKMVTVPAASGKPVGFPTEIADVVIRILDLGGALEFNAGEVMAIAAADPIGSLDWSIEKHLLVIHKCTSRALETYRAHESIAVPLYRTVFRCYDLARKVGFDLDAEIMRKHEFNKTRSFKHGNKRC